jgi:Ser/Thr protein kinase RdoA (MazF antagonist)
MSETGMLFDQEQDSAVWNGLETFSRLPDWLVAARDPDRICDTLSRSVPEFSEGRLLLQKCDVGHIRYKTDRWTGLYHLVTSLPGDDKSQTLVLEGAIYPPGVIPQGKAQVEGAFGMEGWHAVIPELNLKLKTQETESVLGSLAFLTDPEESRHFLMRNIKADSRKYQDIQIQASNPNVVRYKPGSRCTVLYHLEYPQDMPTDRQWPELIVAKIYRGEKGKNAYESMMALWDSPLGSSDTVQIAEPLAYNEQERVMIQGPIREEKTLKRFMTAAFKSGTPEAIEELDQVMRKTAAGLAELHQSNVALGQKWDWEDEMSEVRERIERLSTASPDLAKAADPLLDRIQQLAADCPPDPFVPSHGSFRPAQVLLYRDQIGFIDFDSFCQSEPANDLALFLSTVMSLGLTNSDFDEVRDSGSTMDEKTRRARFEMAMSLSENFLDEYEKHRPISRQRVALWETLDIFMLVLHGWIKVKVGELSDILYLLERFLQSKKYIGTP